MTSKYDYPCERAQYGEPSCYDWLLGESDQPPDHVCGWAQALSKSQFADWWTARQEPLLDVNVSVYYSQHLYDWPAPLGYKALREWYFRRHPLENPEWLERQGGDGSLLAQFLSEQTQDTTPLPLWLLKPVLSRDDVWLALAAPRRTKAGQLWFLGLVEGEFVEGEGGSFWTGEDDKLGVQRFELFPEPYTHSALEADENASLSGAVSMWSKQGQRHYVLSIYSWEYVEPAVLIEAYPTRPGELAALAAEADKLTKWYNATLLGKEFKTRGAHRPVGSKEYWRNRDDFVTAVSAAIRALEAAGKGITQERVHEHLAGHMTRVARPHGKGDYRFDQFKRDRKDYGFSSWEDLRDFCIN